MPRRTRSQLAADRSRAELRDDAIRALAARIGAMERALADVRYAIWRADLRLIAAEVEQTPIARVEPSPEWPPLPDGKLMRIEQWGGSELRMVDDGNRRTFAVQIKRADGSIAVSGRCLRNRLLATPRQIVASILPP